MDMFELYYSPEKYNFETVAEIEWTEPCYDFDITVLWQAVDTKKFYAADDSGCSCPSPFENATFEDLTEITKLQDLIDYLDERLVDSPRVMAQVASMIQSYRDLK